MDDVLLPQEPQSCKQLDGKTAYQPQRHTLEVVVLDEFIQVYAEQLKGNAEMVPEVKVIQHVHHVGGALDVALTQVLKDLHLNQGLMVEPLLVANHLECDVVAGLVIKGANHLPERAFAEGVHHLIAVEYVIAQHNEVIAALIIIGVVVGRARRAADLGRPRAEIPDLREVQNLTLLVVSQLLDVILQDLGRRHWELRLCLFLLLLLLSMSAGMQAGLAPAKVTLRRSTRSLGGRPG
mmetsp:Transcript_35903/g.99552  ORF Transcript_35903/g.99552 Transcript_35903/m.99552 type:complete len:237 (-) Transcript_35903:439-1149(-)